MCEIIARIFYNISQANVGWVLVQYKRDVCLAKTLLRATYILPWLDSPSLFPGLDRSEFIYRLADTTLLR